MKLPVPDPNKGVFRLLSNMYYIDARYPTEHFTDSGPKTPYINVSELHTIQSLSFIGYEILYNDQSGRPGATFNRDIKKCDALTRSSGSSSCSVPTS